MKGEGICKGESSGSKRKRKQDLRLQKQSVEGELGSCGRRLQSEKRRSCKTDEIVRAELKGCAQRHSVGTKEERKVVVTKAGPLLKREGRLPLRPCPEKEKRHKD